MLIKRFLGLTLGFFFLVLTAFAAVFWTIATDSGLNLLAKLLKKHSTGLPVNVQMGEFRGSVINGFTVSDIILLRPDGGKLLEAKSLYLRFSLKNLEEKSFAPERAEINGVGTDFNSVLELAKILPSGDKTTSAKIEPLDFRLTSSDIKKIPGIRDVHVSELSFAKDGALAFDGKIGDVPLSGGGNMYRSHIKKLVLKIGQSGAVSIDIPPFPTTQIKISFSGVPARDILEIFKASFPIEGSVSGTVSADFGGEVRAFGKLRIDGAKIYGVPMGTLESPVEFDAGKLKLDFPKINGSMRGIEKLSGSFSLNTQNGKSSLKLAGENVSLAALQPLVGLDLPISALGGSFNATAQFSKDGPLCDISAKFPSLKIENQTFNSLSVALNLNQDIVNLKFAARTLGAPVNGEGTIATKTGQADINVKLSNVEMASLVPFAPQLAQASPKGIIFAEIICKGNIKSPTFSGTAKANKLSVFGADFQNVNLKMANDGKFTIFGNGTFSAIDFAFNAAGNADGAVFELKDVKLGTGKTRGRGQVSFGKKPTIDIEVDAENVEVRPLLARHGADFGVGGIFTGHLSVKGPMSSPTATLTAKYPLTFNELLLDRLSITLLPRNGSWEVAAQMLLGEAINVELTGKAKKAKNGWTINLSSNRVGMDEIIKLRFPWLMDKIDGRVLFNANLDFLPGGKSVVTLETAHLRLFGFPIRGLRLPVEYANGILKFEVTRGNVGGALIHGRGSIDMKKKTWNGTFDIDDIYLEPLMQNVLEPRGGKLTGRGNLKFFVRGNVGILTNVFGRGEFAARDGALSGLKGLNRINSEGKIEFAEAGGKFIFTGKDIILSSGSYIHAKPDDKHYKYVRFSGPVGISGKGMNLQCAARIDIQVFNILMGALDGLINLAGGGNILKNPVRTLTENVLGVKFRSFNDITFRVIGGWGDPILSDIKLDKQMGNFAQQFGKPAEAPTNRDIEVQFTIPVGPGNSSKSAGDSILEGVFDNIFDNIKF